MQGLQDSADAKDELRRGMAVVGLRATEELRDRLVPLNVAEASLPREH